MGGAGVIHPREPTINTTSMTGHLAGAEGDLGAPTISVKTSMTGSLGGAGAVEPGAPTMNVKNVDDELSVRCRSCRTGSTHHQRKKHRRCAPSEC
jgi:hypothetical protein